MPNLVKWFEPVHRIIGRFKLETDVLTPQLQLGSVVIMTTDWDKAARTPMYQQEAISLAAAGNKIGTLTPAAGKRWRLIFLDFVIGGTATQNQTGIYRSGQYYWFERYTGTNNHAVLLGGQDVYLYPGEVIATYLSAWTSGNLTIYYTYEEEDWTP